MSPAVITCQPSHALQTLASGQRQRQLPSVVIVARRLLLATANGSQNSPTGAATYRPSKLTPTGHRNRRATLELALFNISWASGTIFLIAAVCAVDASGKVTVLLPAFQTIGMAFGTFILGHVIGDMGIAAVPWAVTGFLAAVLLALFTTTAIQKFRLKQEA